MAIKINFDLAHNPETPTLILARKNGDKIGQLNSKAIVVADNMNEASEITFNVYKYIDNKQSPFWDDITNFKLVYCVEWDMWFEISVELDETTETTKTIFCTQLGQAELSQIMLYNIEINTENDIVRDEYIIPTVLYRKNGKLNEGITQEEKDALVAAGVMHKDSDYYENYKQASLLHRIMEKAPHYSVVHVDNSITRIQRTFTFSDVSIYDGFQTIAEELHCLFVFNSNSDKNGNIQRTISVYDLESNCLQCGHRDEFTGVCPKCGSTNIDEGYGQDTTIFITSDELAEDIQFTTDTASIKNCFKLEGGDDLMTATIRNCNPNGTDYIWYFSDDMKLELSDELINEIKSYDILYRYYQSEYETPINASFIESYNALVEKYQKYNENLETIPSVIYGYSSLMNAYYNTVDLALYLQSSLMPNAAMIDTSAEAEAIKLTAENISPVAVTNARYVSLATANSVVLAMAKIVVDSRYRIKVENSSLVQQGNSNIWTWRGNFNVTNYSDEEDTVLSEIINVEINGDYETFVKQKLEKALNKSNTDDLSITGLFAHEYDEFILELKKYSLNCLTSFHDACQACIDILIEQGISDGETWSGQDPNLYNDLYMVYYNKLSAIESEMAIRQSEIDLIIGIYDENDEIVTYGLQNYIVDEQYAIQQTLDFESYLGKDLWLEFCSFRREDKYSNSNYISDGLNNAQLFTNACQFIEVANKEIRKSAELQHSITASLRNLLTIKKFTPLVKYFQVGNWLRVMIDDKVYKLRLVNYEINFDDMNSISVEFSDTIKVNTSIHSIQEVLDQASTMATSYSSVQRQVKQAEENNDIVSRWLDDGFNASNVKIIGGADNQTQTWDEHGMLFRSYDIETNDYSPTQLKIINSTIAITSDNWQSTKTAIGNFNYIDPKTHEMKNAYGINGEVIIGKLMIGEGLGIYNSNGSLTFDENGFSVGNDMNTVTINPNADSIFNIKNKDGNVLSFDDDGNLIVTGNIIAKNLTLLDDAEISAGHIKGFADIAISGDYNDLINAPNFADVAISGDYNDLKNQPKPIDISGKFENPTNNNNAIAGQYLSKTSTGSAWESIDTTIVDNGTKPVNGKAVYDFALSKQQDKSNTNKLLYVNDDGNISFINIDELKVLLA